MKSIFLFAFIACSCSGCASHVPPPCPVVTDTAPANCGTCLAACTRLASLGCSEGQSTNCVDACNAGQTDKLTNFKPACLASANTKDEARACGTVKCQ